MDINLLPIGQIIKAAKTAGVTFGHGDPKLHLAYLTKLRLLPQTIRRKIGDGISGCYPEYVVPLLAHIEDLRNKGLSYSQIKFQLDNPQPKIQALYNPLAFLIIGLILGFLLATNNNSYKQNSQPLGQSINTLPDNLVKTVQASNSASDPIYLIAIPQQNLYKLGQTNISFLK